MNRARYLLLPLCFVAVCLGAFSQVPGGTRFEVVSVKPTSTEFNPNGSRASFHCRGVDSNGPETIPAAPPLGRCAIRNMDFLAILRAAYSLPNDDYLKNQSKGDLGWLGQRYDIDAKADDPSTTTMAQLLDMSRTMLVDQFKLQFHRETKEVPGYVLTVSGSAPKLRDTKEEVDSGINNTRNEKGRVITAHNALMSWFTGNLSGIAAGPIVDRTELTGHYSFTLTWGGPDGPAIFSALPEQLGLKLTSQKVPMEILVIDSVQKPQLN